MKWVIVLAIWVIVSLCLGPFVGRWLSGLTLPGDDDDEE